MGVAQKLEFSKYTTSLVTLLQHNDPPSLRGCHCVPFFPSGIPIRPRRNQQQQKRCCLRQTRRHRCFLQAETSNAQSRGYQIAKLVEMQAVKIDTTTNHFAALEQ